MASFSALRSDVWLLNGEIDQDAQARLLRQVLTTPPDTEVCLLLDSEGGNVMATLSSINIIRRRWKAPFETRAIGDCLSAAVHLLQAGDLRTAEPHAIFMTHPFEWPVQALTPAAAPNLQKTVAKLQTSVARVLADRTDKDIDYWRRFLEKERYFDAKEALRLGLIDQIL